MPVWRFENKASGKGFDFHADFIAACRKAVRLCMSDASVWCVWALPENLKVAEATRHGVYWFSVESSQGSHRTKAAMSAFLPISFTHVALPFGWLGNMAPYPVEHDGKSWRTAEALFQALRFNNEAIKDEIRSLPSPMAAKMRAKRHKTKQVVEPQSEQDVANMEMVLRLKLEQHPELKQRLMDTGDADLIEDCTRRPGGSGKFWGAALTGGQWVGRNVLGSLWMELREEVRSKSYKPIVPRTP